MSLIGYKKTDIDELWRSSDGAVFHSVLPALVKLRPPQPLFLIREIAESTRLSDLFRRNAGFIETRTNMSDIKIRRSRSIDSLVRE